MDKKIINFTIYRYHLLPLTSKSIQTDLFQEKNLSAEEIKERKNEFLSIELNSLEKINNKKNSLKLHDKGEEFFLFKIAQKKDTIITKDFESTVIENEPYSYVIFNNDPEVQKIAISDNKEAFSNPDVVKNILKRVLLRDLKKYGLNIEIKPLFREVKFWNYISKHKDEITYINFQYVKPNLADISSSLPEDFKDFSENVNSHESHLSIKAPNNGTLESINKSNKNINGLVKYASEGAGTIKLKAKGVRKMLNTKENPVIQEVDELSIEGAPYQAIKVYKSIVE